LSKKIPSSGWGPGPGNLNQNGLKPAPLMTSSTKKTKTKKCLNCKQEDLHPLRA